MKVLLRNARVDLYWAGHKHWVGKAEAATDLGTIEQAAELSREEDFEEMEIVVDYSDPVCEQVLPLKPRSSTRQPGDEPTQQYRNRLVAASSSPNVESHDGFA